MQVLINSTLKTIYKNRIVPIDNIPRIRYDLLVCNRAENLSVSAKDTFHESVKRALEKEQWVITADPLKFKFGNVKFQVDLGAERLVAAERGGEKIAVEIKSFLNPSVITDFYAALGQFLSYRLGLASVEPNRKLYLAVPVDVYKTFFQSEFTQTAVQQYQVLLIVYDPTNEVIVQWTS